MILFHFILTLLCRNHPKIDSNFGEEDKYSEMSLKWPPDCTMNVCVELLEFKECIHFYG